eukprot:TRINITY_DN37035_c1_g2_i1.p2 TRINITY_DN37035_c1_g2~~TRINITY_DN37035_c1_g2_i1.p2  ORF type:complete len:174 (-),score=24.34 TRINITY_DN37035_c1_g2_i1:309-830(-)
MQRICQSNLHSFFISRRSAGITGGIQRGCKLICRNMAQISSREELQRMSCAGACGKDTPKIPDQELDERMAQFPAWSLNQERTKISRQFVARNFVAAMNFLNKAGDIAEQEGHHPDFHLTNYREVCVEIGTHSINALSIYDFILATKIDEVEVDYSPKWKEQNAHKLPSTSLT